jgi:hypothetical protein
MLPRYGYKVCASCYRQSELCERGGSRPYKPSQGLLCIAGAMEHDKIGGLKVTTEKKNVAPNGFWKRHLDKIGVGGSLFAALCCLGFPALLSILSAIGLGFLINGCLQREQNIAVS